MSAPWCVSVFSVFQRKIISFPSDTFGDLFDWEMNLRGPMSYFRQNLPQERRSIIWRGLQVFRSKSINMNHDDVCYIFVLCRDHFCDDEQGINVMRELETYLWRPVLEEIFMSGRNKKSVRSGVDKILRKYEHRVGCYAEEEKALTSTDLVNILEASAAFLSPSVTSSFSLLLSIRFDDVDVKWLRAFHMHLLRSALGSPFGVHLESFIEFCFEGLLADSHIKSCGESICASTTIFHAVRQAGEQNLTATDLIPVFDFLDSRKGTWCASIGIVLGILMCGGKDGLPVSTLTLGDVESVLKWVRVTLSSSPGFVMDVSRQIDWLEFLRGAGAPSFDAHGGLCNFVKFRPLLGKEFLMGTICDLVTTKSFMPGIKTHTAMWPYVDLACPPSLLEKRDRTHDILKFLLELTEPDLMRRARTKAMGSGHNDQASSMRNMLKSIDEKFDAHLSAMRSTDGAQVKELQTKIATLEAQTVEIKTPLVEGMATLTKNVQALQAVTEKHVCADAKAERLEAQVLELQKQNVEMRTAYECKISGLEGTVEALRTTLQDLELKFQAVLTAQSATPNGVRDCAAVAGIPDAPMNAEDADAIAEAEFFRIHTPKDGCSSASGAPSVSSHQDADSQTSRTAKIVEVCQAMPLEAKQRTAVRSIAGSDASYERIDLDVSGEMLIEHDELLTARPPKKATADTMGVAKTSSEDGDAIVNTEPDASVDAGEQPSPAIHSAAACASSSSTLTSNSFAATPNSDDFNFVHVQVPRMITLRNFEKPMVLAEMRAVVGRVEEAVRAVQQQTPPVSFPWVAEARFDSNKQVQWLGADENPIEVVTFDFSSKPPVHDRFSCTVVLRTEESMESVRSSLTSDRKTRIDVTELFEAAFSAGAAAQLSSVLSTRWARKYIGTQAHWEAGVGKRAGADNMGTVLDVLRIGLQSVGEEQRKWFQGGFYSALWGEEDVARSRSQTFVFRMPGESGGGQQEFPNLTGSVRGFQAFYEPRPFQVQK